MRKLVIQHVATVVNYEYSIGVHLFQDGTITVVRASTCLDLPWHAFLDLVVLSNHLSSCSLLHLTSFRSEQPANLLPPSSPHASIPAGDQAHRRALHQQAQPRGGPQARVRDPGGARRERAAPPAHVLRED
jgi:hypothetical protein